MSNPKASVCRNALPLEGLNHTVSAVFIHLRFRSSWHKHLGVVNEIDAVVHLVCLVATHLLGTQATAVEVVNRDHHGFGSRDIDLSFSHVDFEEALFRHRHDAG